MSDIYLYNMSSLLTNYFKNNDNFLKFSADITRVTTEKNTIYDPTNPTTKIDLTRTFKFNGSTIDLGDNEYLSAVRILYSNNPLKIPPNDESRGINGYPFMWSTKEMKDDIRFSQLPHGGWENGGSLTAIYIHDRKKIFDLQFVKNTISLSTEDPRLYIKADGNIYCYSMVFYSQTDCQNFYQKLNIPPSAIGNNCVIVNEFRIDFDKIKKTISPIILTYDNANPICLNIHEENKQQIPNTNTFRIFEKNFSPFVYNGKDYISYSVSPSFTVYSREDEKNNKCLPVSNQTPSIFFKLQQAFDNIFNSLDLKKLKLKFSQSSGAIQINDTFIAVGHARFNGFYKYILMGDDSKLTELEKYIPKLADIFKYLKQKFVNGESFFHPDLYLTYFYTFKVKEGKIVITSFSDFYFILTSYINKNKPSKFYFLDFVTNLSLSNDKKKCIISFGEGDVMSYDIEMPLTEIKSHVSEYYQLVEYFNTNPSNIDDKEIQKYITDNMTIKVITPVNLKKLKFKNLRELPESDICYEEMKHIYNGTMQLITQQNEITRQQNQINLLQKTEKSKLIAKQEELQQTYKHIFYTNDGILMATKQNKKVILKEIKNIKEAQYYYNEISFHKIKDNYFINLTYPFDIFEMDTKSNILKSTNNKIYRYNTFESLVINQPLFIDMLNYYYTIQMFNLKNELKNMDLSNYRKEKKCVMTMGSSGVGKTSFFRERKEYYDYIEIDYDKEILSNEYFKLRSQDEYNSNLYSELYKKCGKVAEYRLKFAIKNNLNVLIQSVHPSTQRLLQMYKAGYKDFEVFYKFEDIDIINKKRYYRLLSDKLFKKISYVTEQDLENFKSDVSIQMFGDDIDIKYYDMKIFDSMLDL